MLVPNVQASFSGLLWWTAVVFVAATPTFSATAEAAERILFEAYEQQNWDLWSMNPDGSDRRNLTKTPDVHELYPQASPDGSQICFLVDTPKGPRDTQRDLWLMNSDGTNRRKIAANSRHACWSPDGKTIAFPQQEFPRFQIKDFVSKYLFFYDVASGETRRHPNDKIEHIYVPTWGGDGKWIVTTVHGGMGYGHAIIAIEANGNRVVDLKISGCRPCISSDGQRLTWSSDDHTVEVGELEYTQAGPRVASKQVLFQHDTLHLYHPDLSPDGTIVTFSMGPGGRVAASGPGTHTEVAEMVGVRGKWDIYARTIGSEQPPQRLTQDETLSNKESEWIVTP